MSECLLSVSDLALYGFGMKICDIVKSHPHPFLFSNVLEEGKKCLLTKMFAQQIVEISLRLENVKE